jgi:hypothetical protein
MCSYDGERQNKSVACDVDTNNWGNCKPDDKNSSNICMFFKINKASSLSSKIKEK